MPTGSKADRKAPKEGAGMTRIFLIILSLLLGGCASGLGGFGVQISEFCKKQPSPLSCERARAVEAQSDWADQQNRVWNTRVDQCVQSCVAGCVGGHPNCTASCSPGGRICQAYAPVGGVYGGTSSGSYGGGGWQGSGTGSGEWRGSGGWGGSSSTTVVPSITVIGGPTSSGGPMIRSR